MITTTETLIGSDLDQLVFKILDRLVIQQGIVGIRIPTHIGVVEEYEFVTGLFNIEKAIGYEIQQVILPPPSFVHFDNTNRIQMEALTRRVQRDHDDGIRYNRVYLAVYNDYVHTSVMEAHDIFIEIDPANHRFQATYKDLRTRTENEKSK